MQAKMSGNSGKKSGGKDYYLAMGMILGLIGGAAVSPVFLLVTDIFPFPRCVPFFAGVGMLIGLVMGMVLDRRRSSKS